MTVNAEMWREDGKWVIRLEGEAWDIQELNEQFAGAVALRPEVVTSEGKKGLMVLKMKGPLLVKKGGA